MPIIFTNCFAVQDDKPSCYEESLVGLWTGEGAIPRTPAAATKGNGARYVGNSGSFRITHRFAKLLA